MKAQAAAHEANRKRPGYIDEATADLAISFKTREDVRATLERLAKLVCTGKLEARSVNATILAANGALGAMSEADKVAKRRAEAMTDDELRAAMEAEFGEWQARQEAA